MNSRLVSIDASREGMSATSRSMRSIAALLASTWEVTLDTYQMPPVVCNTSTTIRANGIRRSKCHRVAAGSTIVSFPWSLVIFIHREVVSVVQQAMSGLSCPSDDLGPVVAEVLVVLLAEGKQNKVTLRQPLRSDYCPVNWTRLDWLRQRQCCHRWSRQLHWGNPSLHLSRTRAAGEHQQCHD